ncbi:helix-turn-helix domain-containing protein [Saccharopolyspora shandongensis]|uniref:helix-turn-helix domain-containing protein n=1 Tax=Saccharopolyspora shandongensis TaxID=418495 RepID=UPI0034473F7E
MCSLTCKESASPHHRLREQDTDQIPVAVFAAHLRRGQRAAVRLHRLPLTSASSENRHLRLVLIGLLIGNSRCDLRWSGVIAGARDARRLSLEAQEDLQRKVVTTAHGGMTQAEVARVFAVAPQWVSRWVRAWRKGGPKRLAGRRRGRKPGEQKR